MIKGGIGVALGWIAYLAIILNNLQTQIPIFDEFPLGKQILTTIPLILGHTYVGHRISKKYL